MNEADLTRADLRGARGLVLPGNSATLRNTILVDGSIQGLHLTAGERLFVRDDDGVTNSPPLPWLTPRAPIPVTIQSGLSMVEHSVLELTFDTSPWGSLITFAPGIPVELGGTLALTYEIDPNVPRQIGQTLRFFDWTGVAPIGRFDVQSPYSWDLSKLYTSGEVTLVSQFAPGDFNGDGTVSNEDITPFVAGLLAGTDHRADLNRDGSIDNEDILPFVDMLAVPEPASAALFAAGSLAMLAVRGRRASVA